MKNEIVSLSLSTDSIIAIIGIVVTVMFQYFGNKNAILLRLCLM